MAYQNRVFKPFEHKNAKIKLQTQLGFKVFKGQWVGPVGVMKFAKLTRHIWEASKADDPYADLFLLRIYDLVIQSRKKLQQYESYYRPLLNKEGLELGLFTQKTPTIIPLRFQTPYGYMAAYLLAQFDLLMRLMFSIRQFALLPDEQVSKVIRQSTRLVRQTLSEPLNYKFTGVTRADIHSNNPIAQQAKQLMGEINEQIFFEIIHPPFSPKVMTKPVVKSNAQSTQK